MQTLKALCIAFLLLLGVGLVVALTYFLTIFGGVAIIAIVAYILISEYYRDFKRGD